MTRLFLCLVLSVLMFTVVGHASWAVAADGKDIPSSPSNTPAVPDFNTHGIKLYSSLEEVKALFPDLKKTDGKDPDGDQVWSEAEGYTYYTTGNGQFTHRFKSGFEAEFTSIKFLFSPDNKLLWYMPKREGYTLSADPEGKQLMNDVYRLKVALAREIGAPFADYDFMTKENIGRFNNIYDCLWGMKEYQTEFRKAKLGTSDFTYTIANPGKDAVAKDTADKNGADKSPPPTGPIVNESQTVQQLYGIQVGPPPQSAPKPNPAMDKFKETCFYRSRTVLKAPGGGFSGVVKLDIQSYDDANASIAIEVYSLKAYDLYNRYWARVNGLSK